MWKQTGVDPLPFGSNPGWIQIRPGLVASPPCEKGFTLASYVNSYGGSSIYREKQWDGIYMYVTSDFPYLTTVTAKLSCVLLPIMVSRRFKKTIFSVPNMVVALNCWVCHPTISKTLLPTAVQLRQTILFLGMHSNWDYDTLNRNRVMRNSHDSLDQ